MDKSDVAIGPWLLGISILISPHDCFSCKTNALGPGMRPGGNLRHRLNIWTVGTASWPRKKSGGKMNAICRPELAGVFMRLGVPELVIILIIVVLIFGASRLPELGKGIGKGIRNFKEANKDASKDA